MALQLTKSQEETTYDESEVAVAAVAVAPATEAVAEVAVATSDSPERKLLTRPLRKVLPFPSENAENLSKIEETLNQLIEELSSLEELRIMVDEIVDSNQKKDSEFKNEFLLYFNGFNKRADELLLKLDNEVEYTNNLHDQINNYEKSRQILLLEQQLENEKAQVSLFLTETSSLVKNTLEKIEQKIETLQAVDSLIDSSINHFKTETGEYAKQTTENMKSELQKTYKAFAEGCQKTVSDVQKQSVNFLKQCNDEHIELKENYVPSGRKTKDIMLYAMFAICLVLSGTQILLQVIG